MSNPASTDERVLHTRVLQKDPVASAEVFRRYMDPLVNILRKEMSCDEEGANDFASEAVLTYLERPERYDPDKGRLVTWLIQVAKHQVWDWRRSTAAQSRREQEFARAVELQVRTPKEVLEDSVEAKLLLKKLAESRCLKSEHEWRALYLLLQGERSAESWAEALGLDSLPQEELRRAVKRHRDRLVKVLERFGRKEESNDES